MTRLAPAPEPVRRFTAFLADGTQFEFCATIRGAWGKAVELAHGTAVKRIMGRGATRSYMEERT